MNIEWTVQSVHETRTSMISDIMEKLKENGVIALSVAHAINHNPLALMLRIQVENETNIELYDETIKQIVADEPDHPVATMPIDCKFVI